MKTFNRSFLLANLGLACADINLHTPRGSNNKLNEVNNNVQNANRLFDSQNNAASGYNVGDDCNPVCSNANNGYNNNADGARQGVMQYAEGSVMYIDWTAQHACGPNDKTSCEVILQYSCVDEADPTCTDTPDYTDAGGYTCSAWSGHNCWTAVDDYDYTAAETEDLITNCCATCALAVRWLPNDIRDGSSTQRIPNNENDADEQQYGQHEPYEWYEWCETRERNKGLFLADQFDQNELNNKNTAKYTRQDDSGNRYGYECPEERDYYPYWHPTPWRDIAIFTSDTSRCAMYQAESQNVRNKGVCSLPQANNAQECLSNNGEWKMLGAWNITPPECLEAPWSRDNHNGNGIDGYQPSYNWTLPASFTSEQCTFRIRYNISTGDYESWGGNAADSTSNLDKSVVEDTPEEDFIGLGGEDKKLRLAINSDQLGRTFEDRSHVFKIIPRPEGIPANAKIYNLNVRGRRGNIVQTYPTVEYDFVPNVLHVNEGDYIHYQWTGSDANPAGQAGEGRAMTDRSNIVQIADNNDNTPVVLTKNTLLTNEDGSANGALIDRFALLGQTGCDPDEENQDAVDNCKVLNNAPAYFNGGIHRANTIGTHHFMSTRNNQFSNRSQKGTIVVHSDAHAVAVGGRPAEAAPDSSLDVGLGVAGGVLVLVGGLALAAFLLLRQRGSADEEAYPEDTV